MDATMHSDPPSPRAEPAEPKQRVHGAAAFWDGVAAGYAAQPGEDPEAFGRKIALARERIQPGDTVLNIGCGTGSLSLRLADTGADLHGLDVSPEMIRIARDKIAAAGASNITMHVGPFDRTFDVFADATLDVVMGWSILHLLPDRAGAITQMFALLKPRGQLIASTVCIANTWVPLGPVIAVMRLFGKAPPVASLSTERLMDELRGAGFVDVTLHDVGARKTVAFITARKPG